MAAFSLIDQALRAWTPIPAEPPLGHDDDPLASICGVHIQIRHQGQLIGRGTRLDLTSPSTAGAGRERLQAAFEVALGEANSALAILPNDALRSERVVGLAAEMTLSVEVCGAVLPFTPATWSDVAFTTNPGLTGLALQLGRGSAVESAFPSAMRTANLTPTRALAGLISQAIGEGGAAAALDEPAKLSAERGIRFFQFQTRHVAQAQPRGSAVFLSRGSKVVLEDLLDERALIEMGTALANHLIARSSLASPDTKRVINSTIRPWLDQSEDHEASSAEIALVALALAEFARSPRIGASTAESAQRAAAGLLDHLSALINTPPANRGVEAKAEAKANADAQLIDAAMFLVAAVSADPTLLAQPQQSAGPAPASQRRSAVEIAIIRVSASLVPVTGFAQTTPPVARGLLAEAQTRIAAATRASADIDLARAAVRAAFAETSADRLVSQMPWLGRAELLLTEIGDPTNAAASIPAAVVLRRMRSQVWENQFTSSDAGLDNMDMVGGVVFQTAGSTPLPTWQTARPLAFIARMLRDPQLTDDPERLTEVVKVARSMRFLRQLQVDDAALWNIANPSAAIGGIRAAPWDHAMPLDAGSLSLLCIAEALTSFSSITASLPHAAPKPPELPR